MEKNKPVKIIINTKRMSKAKLNTHLQLVNF